MNPPQNCAHDVAAPTALIQFLDVDIAELHQGGRPGPFAGLFIQAAVVLERKGAARWNARKLGIADDIFAVQLHPKAVTLHGDLERVPFAARLVHALPGRYGGANLGRHLGVGAIAVDLPGADRPHPDIHLALGAAPNVDAPIDIVDFDLD